MKINKIYIVSLCALFLSSCNNFLDEQPTGTMTTDSKLTSKESALALIQNSAYLKNTVFNKMTLVGDVIRSYCLNIWLAKLLPRIPNRIIRTFRIYWWVIVLYISRTGGKIMPVSRTVTSGAQKLGEFENLDASLINGYMAEVVYEGFVLFLFGTYLWWCP